MTFVCVLLVETLPVGSSLHQRIKERLDPWLDATGTWQSSWKLFAPEVDKENSYISATIDLTDGRELSWRTPRWERMTIAQRFRHFRHMEYYDKLRLDENAGAWDEFARHLADMTEQENAGMQVRRVVLTRHWTRIPPPPKGEWPKVGPYLENFSSFDFHTHER